MPARARKDSMDPTAIETHHLWSRCVRGNFLMGMDSRTGRDLSHRRRDMESLLEYLTSVFAVDVGGYHLLDNHFHNILRNRPDIAGTWNDEMVCWRWKLAWPRWENGEWRREVTDDEIHAMLQRDREQPGYLAKVRRNLADISWFQARLKQIIAVKCNRETKHRGHHWEQRFGNRRLDSNEEVVGAIVYDALQQVRAGTADSLESSDYSAIQRRMRAAAEEAYRDAHGREAGDTDEEQKELEHLEALLANCFLAPISDDAPGLTVLEKEPPPEELVLPLGYHYQQAERPDKEKRGGRSEQEARPECQEPAETSIDERPKRAAPAKAKRGRGRPKKDQTYHWDRRFRELQKRRPSRSSIIDGASSRIIQLAATVAEVVVAERAAAPAAGNSAAGPSDTSSTWRRQATEFAEWLKLAATKLPKHLAALLGVARGDPSPDSS